jgi:WD40 repeat protein
MTRTLICAVVFVLSAATALAAPPVATLVPRLDSHGHPLPSGAIARLGDYRLRFSTVRSFSFSPDGRLIARSRHLGTDIREVATGRDVTPAFVRGLRGTVEFTPGGRLYHADPDANTYRVLDAATGTVRVDLSAPGRQIQQVQFLSGDRGIAAVVKDPKDDYQIRLFSTADGTNPPGGVTIHPPWVRFAVLSEGRQIAISLGQGLIVVHDATTGARLHSHNLKNYGTNTSPLVALPDGKSVLVVHHDQLITLQVTPNGIETGDTSPGFQTTGNVRLTTDGTGMLLTGSDGSFWHMTWPGRQVIRKVERPMALWRWAEPVPSADGRLVVEHGWLDGGRVLDLAAGKELFRYGEMSPVRSVHPLPGGRVRVSDSASTREYELASGREIGLQSTPVVESELGSATSPDGGSFTTGSAFGRQLVLRESGTGRERWHFDPPGAKTGGGEQVCNAVFRPGGREVLAVLSERSVLLDAATGREIAEYPGGTKATFSADGRLLATGRKPPIRVIELSTRGVRQTFDTPKPTINDTVASRLRFSRDGRFLAGFGCSFGAVVWSVDDGAVVYCSMNTSPDNGFAVGDISPDGRWLAHADRFEHRVQVWDWTKPQVGTRPVILRGHHGEFTDVAFTPDGKYLLTAGQDGTVLVWDMAWIAREAAVRPPHRTEDELWDDLASRDAAVAGPAVVEWARRPAAAVERFRRELPPARNPDPNAVAALVARLDHDDSATRDAAEAELATLAELAADALRPIAERSASAEQRARARRLLDRLGTVVADPWRLRVVRAVEVVERVGTPDARRLLTDWAAGADRALLTREARAALERLTER